MELAGLNIKFLPGVGEKKAAVLYEELQVQSYEDMLYHVPFKYIDRSKIYSIAELNGRLPYIQIKAKIRNLKTIGEGKALRMTATAYDETGTLELVWFKGFKFLTNQIEPDKEYLIFGQPSEFNHKLNIVHPEIDSFEKASQLLVGFQAVYPTTEKMKKAFLNSKAISKIQDSIFKTIKGKISETLPAWFIQQHKLMYLHEALYNIHFPENPDMLRKALFRLKFEELFYIQLNILKLKYKRKTYFKGHEFKTIGEYFNTFYHRYLPFELTDAQKRVIKEIRQDCGSGKQMNRLLQGDVGSGKTLVAVMCMLMALDNCCQTCLMAPTEILARQHYATLTRLLDGLTVRVAILTGASKARERRAALEGVASGEVQLLVGTHALIEDRVRFANLGLVVIDEQHRFGVEQRARMWTKNEQPPHVLVMTATPIPRTLAMTLYGDLDVSVIDELPPGRRPVRTVHYTDAARLRVWGFLRQEIARGRQAYVVYPLIEESESMDYKDLQDGYEAISRDFPLPEYVVEVVHGRMKPEDKEAAMRRFKSGEAQILVSTTVIEVGVDVPNATVMVIESAERFGLSQLHQLRGRVGRGAEQSYCILMSGEKLSKEARARLDAMCQTNDGFRLAELDLKLRGAGDIAGTQQSGMAFDLKIANPTLDVQILQLTRDAAGGVLAADAALAAPEHAGLRELKRRYSGEKSIDFSMIS